MKIFMKAPKGVTHAEIEGHSYDDIPLTGSKAGLVEVKNAGHIDTLKRHGFVEADDVGEPDYEAMTDEQLIVYIEEHGGDADSSMKRKKLLRLAAEAYNDSQES